MRQIPLYVNNSTPVERAQARSVDSSFYCPYCEKHHSGVLSADLQIEHAETTNPVGGVLVVGEYPTSYEYDNGRPFSYGSNLAVRQEIEKHTKLPVVYDFAFKCKYSWVNGKIKPPKDEQKAHHLGYIKGLIDEMKPSKIICFGKEAYETLVGCSIPAKDCRGGYHYLSDGTPVFLLDVAKNYLGNRFLHARLRKELKRALTTAPPLPPWKGVAYVVETVADVEKALKELRATKWTTFDTETAGQQFEPYFYEITCLAATPAGKDYAYVWGRKALKNPELLEPLKDFLKDEDCPKNAHNAKFDIKAVCDAFDMKEGDGYIQFRGLFADSQLWLKQTDTEALTRLEYAAALVGMAGHKQEMQEALDAAKIRIKEARELAHIRGYVVNQLPGMFEPIIAAAIRFPDLEPETFAYGLVNEEVMIRYCALDTVAADRLVCLLEPIISESEEMSRVWNRFLKPATMTFAQVESWGMPINKKKLSRCIALLRKDKDKVIKKLASLGCTIDLNKDLEEYLYDVLKLPVLGETKTGQRSLDSKTLNKLFDQTDNPIVKLVLEFKKIEKLLSVYGTGLATLTRTTGRLHGRLKLDGTRSGRLSMEDPNMQQVPSGPPYSKHIKGCFQARDGYVIIQLDYSQLEYRIVAALANDDTMRQAFLNNEDLHMNTAKRLARDAFGMEPENVGKEERRLSKAYGFGTLYGQAAATIAKTLGITLEKAESIQKSFKSAWQGVMDWIEDRKRDAHRTGSTFTYWVDEAGNWVKNRCRHLPGLAGSSEESGTCERASFNTPIQGTASDFMLATNIKVVDWIIEEKIPARVINTVHDSIILEVRADYALFVTDVVKAIMEMWPCGDIPLVADAEIGLSWGSLIPYEQVLVTKAGLANNMLDEELSKVLNLEEPEELGYYKEIARLAA